MEKINKCPMCGIHQSIKYSDDVILSIENAFAVLYEGSLRTQKKRDELYKQVDTLKARAELFDEAVKVCEWLDNYLGGEVWCSLRDREGSDEWAENFNALLSKAKELPCNK